MMGSSRYLAGSEVQLCCTTTFHELEPPGDWRLFLFVAPVREPLYLELVPR